LELDKVHQPLAERVLKHMSDSVRIHHSPQIKECSCWTGARNSTDIRDIRIGKVLGLVNDDSLRASTHCVRDKQLYLSRRASSQSIKRRGGPPARDCARAAKHRSHHSLPPARGRSTNQIRPSMDGFEHFGFQVAADPAGGQPCLECLPPSDDPILRFGDCSPRPVHDFTQSRRYDTTPRCDQSAF